MRRHRTWQRAFPVIVGSGQSSRGENNPRSPVSRQMFARKSRNRGSMNTSPARHRSGAGSRGGRRSCPCESNYDSLVTLVSAKGRPPRLVVGGLKRRSTYVESTKARAKPSVGAGTTNHNPAPPRHYFMQISSPGHLGLSVMPPRRRSTIIGCVWMCHGWLAQPCDWENRQLSGSCTSSCKGSRKPSEGLRTGALQGDGGSWDSGNLPVQSSSGKEPNQRSCKARSMWVPEIRCILG